MFLTFHFPAAMALVPMKLQINANFANGFSSCADPKINWISFCYSLLDDSKIDNKQIQNSANWLLLIALINRNEFQRYSEFCVCRGARQGARAFLRFLCAARRHIEFNSLVTTTVRTLCKRFADVFCSVFSSSQFWDNRCIHITDIGVGYISTMLSLTALFLRWCSQVRDFGLQHLCSMRNLQILSLAG